MTATTGLVALVALAAGSGTTDAGSRQVQACIDSGLVCERVYDWTGNETLADWAEWVVGKPLTILLVLFLAWLASRIAKRAIARIADQVRRNAAAAPGVRGEGEVARLRIEQRTTALSSVLTSIAKALIWVVALLVVLGELGIDIGPLVAGAGIAGVALGFGAQSLVKDFLTGIFMLAEDQYGVGDVVDLGEATGTVEKVTLRTTVLRDIYGTVWHVPNGEILRVGNKSQHWAVALIDLGVAYGADLEEVAGLVKATADDLYGDDEWRAKLLEEPEYLGVQSLDADAVTVRVSIKTEPAAQFAVQRELLRRLKDALDRAGIEIPYPQRTVWLRHDDPEAEAAAS